jgi:hypothetical protein
MVSKPAFSTLSLVLVAGLALCRPAAGDWLVTHEGDRIETRGPWEVQGRLVVFHTPGGVFSSIGGDAVDLDRSAALTESMKSAKAAAKVAPPEKAAPRPRPKARYVLTDADVEHVEESAPASEPGESDDGAAPRKSRARKSADLAKSPLEVTSWNAVLGASADGISISGVIKNPSEYFASSIAIEVTVLSLEGEVLASKSVSAEPKALGPGEQGSFRATFPDVFSVGTALFEVTSFDAVVNESADGI